MKKKKGLRLLATLSVIVALLAGCSGGGGSTQGSTEKSGETGNKLTVIKIASQSPLSGGSAVQGEAVKLGAQMSLDDNKAEFEKLGFDLQFVPYDDQGDPKKGAANAELIGADQSILGVVGRFNSGVSIPSSVIYEKYNTVMVTPANTANAVTDRGLKGVNRIVARDDVLGPAAAGYAVNTIGAKSIFIIQDKTAYGQGFADAFKGAAESLGAKVIGYEGITVGEKDFNGVLNQVLAKKPDFIFFGGLYAEGGVLIKQAREKGINVPFMSGAGFDSKGIIDIAGESIKNTYFGSTLSDVTKTDSGKQWADKYNEKYGKKPEGFSAYSYDAMSVLLNGVKEAIKANGGKLPSREQVRDAVRATKEFQGIATKVSFDSKGDNDLAKVYMYKYDAPAYPGTFITELERPKK